MRNEKKDKQVIIVKIKIGGLLADKSYISQPVQIIKLTIGN